MHATCLVYIVALPVEAHIVALACRHVAVNGVVALQGAKSEVDHQPCRLCTNAQTFWACSGTTEKCCRGMSKEQAGAQAGGTRTTLVLEPLNHSMKTLPLFRSML